MSTASPRINALDGVRSIAAAVVVPSHFLVSTAIADTPGWKVVKGGWLGVDLFFVLKEKWAIARTRPIVVPARVSTA